MGIGGGKVVYISDGINGYCAMMDKESILDLQEKVKLLQRKVSAKTSHGGILNTKNLNDKIMIRKNYKTARVQRINSKINKIKSNMTREKKRFYNEVVLEMIGAKPYDIFKRVPEKKALTKIYTKPTG